jgi:hypothetical protein
MCGTKAFSVLAMVDKEVIIWIEEIATESIFHYVFVTWKKGKLKALLNTNS